MIGILPPLPLWIRHGITFQDQVRLGGMLSWPNLSAPAYPHARPRKHADQKLRISYDDHEPIIPFVVDKKRDGPTTMTPHRKHLKSYNIPGHAHELTFPCFHRLPLFSKDRTRQWFVETKRTEKHHAASEATCFRGCVTGYAAAEGLATKAWHPASLRSLKNRDFGPSWPAI